MDNFDPAQYDSDKVSYLRWYNPFFLPLVEKEIKLLEIGIDKGGSLVMWKDYFQKGSITGVDIKLPGGFTPPERVKMYEGDQRDTEFLRRVAEKEAPEGFDIIIDDGSHYGKNTKITFWTLLPHLKKGGFYVIEDWATGYLKNWSDGRELDLKKYEREDTRVSKLPLLGHNYGMVGFVKQLVDEQGAGDVTRHQKEPRYSKFEQMVINPAFVLIEK
jgi:hypothetical protein